MGDLELKVGQHVFHQTLGFGTVVAITDQVTVKFGDTECQVGTDTLVTQARAELDWHTHWLSGAARRLEEGRQLWIVKELCLAKGFGEWAEFIRKYDQDRTTCDRLIRNYKDETTWAAQDQQLNRHRNGAGADEAPEPIAVPGPDRKINPPAPDAEADRRKEAVEREKAKRAGRKPSHHRTDWSTRIPLPPEVASECREASVPVRKAYMQRAAYGLLGYVFLGTYANEPSPALYVLGVPGNPDLSSPYDQSSEDKKYGAMLREALDSSPLVISVAGPTHAPTKTRTS